MLIQLLVVFPEDLEELSPCGAHPLQVGRSRRNTRLPLSMFSVPAPVARSKAAVIGSNHPISSEVMSRMVASPWGEVPWAKK